MPSKKKVRPSVYHEYFSNGFAKCAKKNCFNNYICQLIIKLPIISHICNNNNNNSKKKITRNTLIVATTYTARHENA